MGGSSGSESSSEPWGALKPYLKDYYQQAQDAYNATGKDPFGGTLDPGASAATLQAQQQQLALAGTLGGVGNNVMQLGQDQAAGKFLDINNNQYAQGAINAAIDPVQQRYQEQVIPQMQSAAIAGGAYGGDREAILSAQAGQGFAREAQNTSAQMAGDFYNRERVLQQNSPALIQSGVGLNSLQSQLTGQVGQSQEFYKQQALNELFRQHNDQQNAPWNGMQQYGSALNSGSNFYNNTSSPGSQGALMGGMQGAAGGAMMGMPWMTKSGGWSIPAGMIAGGLFGGFGA